MSRPKKTVNSVENTAAVKPEKVADPKILEKLQGNEQIIALAQRTFLDAGLALKAIRDEKLFEAAGHDSFETYCVKKWNYSLNYANRLIAAFYCNQVLKKEFASTGEILPSNEFQYRALMGLKESLWVKTWKEVLKHAAGKPVTGEMVETVVNKLDGINSETKKTKSKKTAAKTKNPPEAKKLAKIGKLVEEALDEKSKFSNDELIKLLEKIQKLVAD